ncbi:MAG: T9SS type A sorting domain-containing protein, partial [Candidatus Calescibacterium sp.]|nr:T9SS type A sorting domain-containing protein [Candidatus Calescibacterium sp.]
NIYRSLTPNFIIDSTKLIGTTKDTNYVDILTQSYQRLYYKLTCVDKQGNQSRPSEELMVNLTSINEYPRLVNEYYLYQNYPNPFNGSTIISYKLKERGYVKLMVYDIKGERIAVLVNEEKEAGYYEEEFPSVETGQAPSLPSGIYLYRIEVIGEGNIPVYTEMRKMVLVK